jgi:hypothetical protein
MLIKDYWWKWVVKLIDSQTSALLYLAAFPFLLTDAIRCRRCAANGILAERSRRNDWSGGSY